MDFSTCKICGKEIKESELNICLNCGSAICADDFDSESGYCKNCIDNGPYLGC